MNQLNALVIGNGVYKNSAQLKNPPNDAEDISKVLRNGGFNVKTLTNATYRDMKNALREFEDSSKDSDGVSLFFFAGHGVEVGGENYLIANDTDVENKTDIQTTALPLNEVISRMEAAEDVTRTSIIILDACRDDPFKRPWRSVSRGLAPVYAPRGTLLAFSTSPGQVASDGDGRNGLYTEALLKHIEEPDLPIEAMFKRVRNTLGAKTRQHQISWEHTSLAGEFFFNLSTTARINTYSPAAIKDKTFLIDESKWTHKTINALKSHNWYSQNPAIDVLTPKKLDGALKNNLFVLGRNILQAANGSANSAIDFIKGFREKTDGMNAEKRKALLDGIIFEIFFDSMGELRKIPKSNFFNDVFELQIYPEFKENFNFIASALSPYAKHFFRVPGSNLPLSIDIGLGDILQIEEVFIDGKNYLFDETDLEDDDYQLVNKNKFEIELSQQILVPHRLLKIVYSNERDIKGKIRKSYWAEVKRP
ncbi:caspase domain-containing protein [Yersinia enterocolitica]|uniref:caspase family protein n=1 Tax=Yersinia enterocolitica TaxID=630 RepID=UPI001F5752C0|nr:caspase family protein [Yersinia enterocolitica]